MKKSSISFSIDNILGNQVKLEGKTHEIRKSKPEDHKEIFSIIKYVTTIPWGYTNYEPTVKKSNKVDPHRVYIGIEPTDCTCTKKSSKLAIQSTYQEKLKGTSLRYYNYFASESFFHNKLFI